MRNSKTSSMGKLNPVAASDTKLGSSDGQYEEQRERYKDTQAFLSSKFDINSKNDTVMSNVPVAASSTKLGSSDGKYEELQERYKETQAFLASKFDTNLKNDDSLDIARERLTKIGISDNIAHPTKVSEMQVEMNKKTDHFSDAIIDRHELSFLSAVDEKMKSTVVPLVEPLDANTYNARKEAATNGCMYIASQYNLPESKRDSYEKQQDTLINMGCVHGILDIKAAKVYEGGRNEPGLLSNAEAMITLYVNNEENRAQAEQFYLSTDTDTSMYAYLRSAKNDASFTKDYFANEGLKAVGITPMNESIDSSEYGIDVK